MVYGHERKGVVTCEIIQSLKIIHEASFYVFLVFGSLIFLREIESFVVCILGLLSC